MKHLSILGLLLFALSACSKEEPKPTLTKSWDEGVQLYDTSKEKDPELPESVKKEISQPKQKQVFIHLGSFQTSYFFEEMVAQLEKDGYKPLTSSRKIKGERKFKSVKIGPFPKSQALIIKDILLKKGYPKDMFLK